MEIRRALPDDAEAVRAAYAVDRAVQEHERPSLPPLTLLRKEAELRHGWDGTPGDHYVGWVDGEPVVTGKVDPGWWDNRDLAEVYVAVRPDRRRRGHGSRFLSEMIDLAGQRGCVRLIAGCWDVPGVVEFAEHHGFTSASRDVHRVQWVRRREPGRIEALRDEALARAGDYELVEVEGHSPAELLPGIADVTASINDAPLDDLDYDDEVFPVERIEAYERAVTEGGRRLWRLLARHRESGELAGHTVVVVDEDQPGTAHQHDTAVARSHRGHGLGLLLKTQMVLWLEEVEPQVERIDTFNAESNEHMIAVNDAMGYEVGGTELVFQRRL